MNNTTQQTVQAQGPKNKDGSPNMRYKVNREVLHLPVRTLNGWTYTITHPQGNMGRSIFFSGSGQNQLINLSRQGSAISCGVHQVSGIAALSRTTHIPRELVISALREAFAQMKHRSCAFLTMSNYTTTFVDSIMNEICNSHTEYRRNPNSGSRISVWVY